VPEKWPGCQSAVHREEDSFPHTAVFQQACQFCHVTGGWGMKRLIRRALDAVGLEVRRTRVAAGGFPAQPFAAQQEFIGRLGIDAPQIFDVGAHRGETVAAYRKLFPHAEIVCFEAFPGHASVLRERFAADTAIKVQQQAVTNSCGSRTFHVNHHDATSSLLPRAEGGRRYYHSDAGSKMQIEVETVSIDDFMAINNIAQIDILKFDIQGGELMALEGAQQALQSAAVSIIYTEALFAPHYQGNPLLHDIWQYLERFDYTLFDIYNPYHARNGQLRFADAMFVSPDTRSQVLDAYAEEP
jgi:FkbM family methyltransferase